MADGDDGDDEFTIVDLVNDAIIADADAPGIAAFELFATRRARVLFQLHHFIFYPGGNGVGVQPTRTVYNKPSGFPDAQAVTSFERLDAEIGH